MTRGETRGTEYVDGRLYRIRFARGMWAADGRCDCIFGPHWHEQAIALTRRKLIARLREEPAADGEPATPRGAA